MNMAQENLSKADLITILQQQNAAKKKHEKINSFLQEENTYLKSQVELTIYQKMQSLLKNKFTQC